MITFLTYDIKNYYLSFVISFIFDIIRRIMTFFRTRFGVFRDGAKMTSLLKFDVTNKVAFELSLSNLTQDWINIMCIQYVGCKGAHIYVRRQVTLGFQTVAS